MADHWSLLREHGQRPDAASVVRIPPVLGPAPDAQVLADWQKIRPELWLECWGAMDGKARMLLTPERILLCGDKRATAILEQEDELRLRRLRVETSDRSELKRFEELLAVEDGELRDMCIRRRDGDGHLLLKASRLALLGGMPLIALVLHHAGSEYHSSWADLSEIFNLTPAEHRVVLALLHGHSAETISKQQKLSINTVRTHIRHAYEKLDITCREALWRRLAPYRTA